MGFFGCTQKGRQEAVIENCCIGSLFKTKESFHSGGIHAYVKALSPATLQAALYNNSCQIICRTEPLLYLGNYNWVTLPYPEPLMVPSNEPIWLILVVLGKIAIKYSNGGKGIHSNSPIIHPVLDATFYNDREYSIYDNLPANAINTIAATGIGTDNVTLNGSSEFHLLETSCDASFLYDTSSHVNPADYASETAPPTHQVAEGAFSFALGSLSPSTTYYFRAKGVFGMGETRYGSELSFNTLSGAAVVKNVIEIVRVPRAQHIFIG